MRGRNLGIAIGTTLALLLARCGGGTGSDTTTSPTTTPTTETSSEPTTATTEPSPEPTPEESPSTDPWALGPPRVTWAMSTNNEEGAIAFVEYYVQLANYSYATLDTTDLARIADINCVGCQATLDSIAIVAQNGYQRIGGERVVDEILSVTYYEEFHTYSIDITRTDASAELLDSTGTVIQTADSITAGTGYIAEYVGPYDWKMIAVGKLEDES